MVQYGAQNTVIEYGADVGLPAALVAPGSDTFAAVNQVQSLTGPGLEKAEIDVTALDSTARESLSDLPTPGTVEFTIFLDGSDVGHQAIKTDADSPARARNWRITVNDAGTTASTLDFVAEVQSWNPSFEQGAAVQVAVTLKVSGPVAETWRT